ncbi:alpha/beta fold hydrolase, partial [Klebsiella sp. K822]
EFIRSMSLRLGPDVFVRQLQLQRNSPVSLTGTVNFPVLIVASASDELRTLSEAEALHSDYPASVLHVIENAGHMLPLEQPDKLMQVIKEWLHDTGII